MNILEIYKKYQIMPQLQEHQLAVAAVAEMICENFKPSPRTPLPEGEGKPYLDHDIIVAACLLHDMGNIVKFNFDQTKEYKLAPQEVGRLDYWKVVKEKFMAKYGTDSHNVTIKIIKEIGVSARVFELIDCVGFDQGADNAATDDFGKKICAYSDMRVMPAGACSLEERMADLRVRYKNHPEGAHNRDVFEAALRQIERQIFENCDIKPEDITEKAIADRKEWLKGFEI